MQVTIVLKDVNDLSPEFITPNETSVPENIPVNTVVMAVKALDRDEGRNSYIEYTLSATEPGLGSVFSLGPVDGLLRVSGRLDRETRANYTLEVTARDRGDPPRQTKEMILVRVLDENDNSPVFDPKQYSASVAENASIGASVLQVRYQFCGVSQNTIRFLVTIEFTKQGLRNKLEALYVNHVIISDVSRSSSSSSSSIMVAVV